VNAKTKQLKVYSYPSPAKLNLCLKILGRGEDGYHQLQTVFQFLDCKSTCHDTLHFTLRENIDIALLSSMSMTNKDNLVLKAAHLLKDFAHSEGKTINHGVDIKLDKHLPIGGGIGGGSSNAATTLLVLNKLWQLAFTKEQLACLGLQLGADVPVFVQGKAAVAEGRGERLNAIQVPEYWFVLLKPRCQVSTAEIFQHQQLTRDSSPRTIRAFLAEIGRAHV